MIISKRKLYPKKSLPKIKRVKKRRPKQQQRSTPISRRHIKPSLPALGAQDWEASLGMLSSRYTNLDLSMFVEVLTTS
jgi:hypothetical protein